MAVEYKPVRTAETRQLLTIRIGQFASKYPTMAHCGVLSRFSNWNPTGAKQGLELLGIEEIKGRVSADRLFTETCFELLKEGPEAVLSFLEDIQALQEVDDMDAETISAELESWVAAGNVESEDEPQAV